MITKEPGYVYILTNPNFRKDWVKIALCDQQNRPHDQEYLILCISTISLHKLSKEGIMKALVIPIFFS